MRTLRRRLAWHGVGWVLGALAWAAQRWTPPSLAEEWYARRAYPSIVRALTATSRWFPGSLGEVLAALTGVALCGALAWVVWPPRGWARRAGTAVLRLTSALGWVAFAFSTLWGVNYRRPPMAQRLGIPTGGTVADLVEAARWLAGEAARLAPPGDASAPTRLPFGRAELDAHIEDAFARAAELEPLPGGPLGPAKPVRASELLSRLGLSGIYSPFTGEANYNALQPDSDLPFSIAHEKAHQRGIASEDEANFAAFVALSASPEPYLRYSAALNAAGYVLTAVARVDPAAYRGLCRLVEGRPMADWKRSREFWARYRGPAQRVSQRINDLYLRANRVPGGVLSYGAVTDLLVGYHRARRHLQGRPEGAGARRHTPSHPPATLPPASPRTP